MIINKTKKHFSQKVTKQRGSGVEQLKGNSTLEKAMKTSKRRQKYEGMTNKQLTHAKIKALAGNVFTAPVRAVGSIYGAEVVSGARAINVAVSPYTTPIAALTGRHSATTKNLSGRFGKVYKKLSGNSPSKARKALAGIGTGVASLGIVPVVASKQLVRSAWRGAKAPWKTFGQNRSNIAAVKATQAQQTKALQASMYANAAEKLKAQQQREQLSSFNTSKLEGGIADANTRIKALKQLQMQGLTPAEIENTMSTPKA